MDLKMILIILLVIGQISIYVFAFTNPHLFITCLIISIVIFIILFSVLIYERIKEKKEDEKNDYRNY